MRRASFRTAQTNVKNRVRKFGAGVLMMGLALSASAKDGATAAVPSVEKTDATAETLPNSAVPKVNPKPTARTRARARERAKHWLQVGLASWYGMQFQGRRTAAGETFDLNGMTCAHPTLPMGTWLRVTNLKNRKTAFVRVNDRGPVLEGRIVDLSQAAARVLGMAGVANVKLEAVRDGDPEMARELMAQVQMPLLFPAMAR
jgi:rare lipoprotein A